jgi:hypothetical protein
MSIRRPGSPTSSPGAAEVQRDAVGIGPEIELFRGELARAACTRKRSRNAGKASSVLPAVTDLKTDQAILAGVRE